MTDRVTMNGQLKKDFNFRKSDIDAVNYNFDTMMYLSNVREEHVVTYREAVKAARDFLDGIAIVTQGRLPRALISDNRNPWQSGCHGKKELS